MVLESTAWGKLLPIIRLIQFSTVLWLRGWGLDLGKAKTMKSLIYGTSGINRFKASTVYAVIWFFYSLGIDGLGEAFADYTALSALYCVYTVWDRRPGEASADDTALYGVLF